MVRKNKDRINILALALELVLELKNNVLKKGDNND